MNKVQWHTLKLALVAIYIAVQQPEGWISTIVLAVFFLASLDIFEWLVGKWEGDKK